MNNMTGLQFKIRELKLTKRILVLSGKDVSDIDKQICNIQQEILKCSSHKKNKIDK